MKISMTKLGDNIWIKIISVGNKKIDRNKASLGNRVQINFIPYPSQDNSRLS